jgi:hypothetical protein
MASPFTVSHTLTNEQIADAISWAFDGGSTYWCRIFDCLAPTTWEFETKPSAGEHQHYSCDYPLNPGGEVLIVDEESDDDGVLTLDTAAIQRGLAILAEKYPHHIVDILKENGDANTGDAFLQCCLFGDIIYG